MGEHESEIDGLIDEHRDLMTIMGQLRDAGNVSDPKVQGLLDQLETALAHHTEREEAGLFHTLRQVEVGPEYMDLFEHDHGHLVDLIESARRDRHTVDDLIQAFEAHMLREENDMFPAAEQLLGPPTGTPWKPRCPPAVAASNEWVHAACVRRRAGRLSTKATVCGQRRVNARAGSARTSPSVPSSRR